MGGLQYNFAVYAACTFTFVLLVHTKKLTTGSIAIIQHFWVTVGVAKSQ